MIGKMLCSGRGPRRATSHGMIQAPGWPLGDPSCWPSLRTSWSTRLEIHQAGFHFRTGNAIGSEVIFRAIRLLRNLPSRLLHIHVKEVDFVRGWRGVCKTARVTLCLYRIDEVVPAGRHDALSYLTDPKRTGSCSLLAADSTPFSHRPKCGTYTVCRDPEARLTSRNSCEVSTLQSILVVVTESHKNLSCMRQ